ncbi:MAG TPA: FAD:protein FMN transferase [Bacteroidales bacterium]|nr:FAD:protein FMN transferase [Bacteroidales bacterium]
MKKICFCSICIIFLLTSCRKTEIHQFSDYVFGTYYSISYTGEENPNLPKQVDSVLRTINLTFSVFDSNSLVSRINRNEIVQANADFGYLFGLSKKISEETNYAFDVTVGPIIEAWGFGNTHDSVFPTQAYIDSLRCFVGTDKVELRNGQIIKKDSRIEFDFNAIAKGYAVDKVSKWLLKSGYRNFIVDIGGEVVCRGKKMNKTPWRIGIQIPTEDKDGIIESDYTFELGDRAIATSGNYRNYVEKNGTRFSHIINPQTGIPEKSSLLSVSVIAPDCTTADAYATAFMVLGIDKSMQVLDKNPLLAAHFIYYENGNYQYKQTANFPKSID